MMFRNFLLGFIVAGNLFGTAFGQETGGITEMKVFVVPETAKIRPLETAVLRVEFYGKEKKKGILERIFGGDDEKKRVQSDRWEVELAPGAGTLSKPFLYQQEDEKTRGGIENLIRQGIGAASAKDAVLYTAPSAPGRYRLTFREGGLSQRVTIEVSRAAPSRTVRETAAFPVSTAPDDPYFELAAHYAPFIAQETWFNPKADYLSRFDFDGNWKGEDNWENLYPGSSQAFVYYASMETATHWFLIYNFFHPRDYSDFCIVGTCHENDNEGLVLAVRRDGSRFGRPEVMETLAHNNIYTFTADEAIGRGAHDIDGPLELLGGRPVVFIEAGGHGVYGSGYKSSRFSAEKMDFTRNTGVTYVYKNKAERPRHADDRNVGYALLPIRDEWYSRGFQETDRANETFGDFFVYEPYGGRPKARAGYIAGAFRGRTAGDNRAKPFWAWHDRRTRDRKLLNTGQWALDPAYALSVNLEFPAERPVALEYVFNPYLEIDPAPAP